MASNTNVNALDGGANGTAQRHAARISMMGTSAVLEEAQATYRYNAATWIEEEDPDKPQIYRFTMRFRDGRGTMPKISSDIEDIHQQPSRVANAVGWNMDNPVIDKPDELGDPPEGKLLSFTGEWRHGKSKAKRSAAVAALQAAWLEHFSDHPLLLRRQGNGYSVGYTPWLENAQELQMVNRNDIGKKTLSEWFTALLKKYGTLAQAALKRAVQIAIRERGKIIGGLVLLLLVKGAKAYTMRGVTQRSDLEPAWQTARNAMKHPARHTRKMLGGLSQNAVSSKPEESVAELLEAAKDVKAMKEATDEVNQEIPSISLSLDKVMSATQHLSDTGMKLLSAGTQANRLQAVTQQIKRVEEQIRGHHAMQYLVQNEGMIGATRFVDVNIPLIGKLHTAPQDLAGCSQTPTSEEYKILKMLLGDLKTREMYLKDTSGVASRFVRLYNFVAGRNTALAQLMKRVAQACGSGFHWAFRAITLTVCGTIVTLTVGGIIYVLFKLRYDIDRRCLHRVTTCCGPSLKNFVETHECKGCLYCRGATAMRHNKQMIQLEVPTMRCWGCWYKPSIAKIWLHGSGFDRGFSVLQRQRQKGDWTAGSEVQATHGAILRELPECISDRARHSEVILIVAAMLATTPYVLEHRICSDDNDDTIGLIEPILAVGDSNELPSSYSSALIDRSAANRAFAEIARGTMSSSNTQWGSGPSGSAPGPSQTTAVEVRDDGPPAGELLTRTGQAVSRPPAPGLTTMTEASVSSDQRVPASTPSVSEIDEEPDGFLPAGI